jgi:hypothetical protein
MNTNKTMEQMAPYGIGYTEQMEITGGRCVVTCAGWNVYNDGTTGYDLLYSENGTYNTVCNVPDRGNTSPYSIGQVVAVYP